MIYCEWYGVCDFVVLSVVEVCADYGGVNLFHVCLNFGVVYGVWGLCQCLWCMLFVSYVWVLFVVGVWGVVIFVLSVMCVVGGVLLWVECVFCRVFGSVRTPSCYSEFCVICMLLMFVSDAIGDHMVETYSSMGLVVALYVARIVSFYFLHVVDVSALSICIVWRGFVVVISMCWLYVSLGSRVSPSILVCCSWGV